MRRVWFALSLVLGVLMVANPAFAAPRAFTIEDLYRVQNVSSASLDPAGRWLVYTLETRDFGRGKSTRDLYRLPLEGGEPQRLTWTEKAAEGSPFWSPDGKQVGFVAARNGQPQIWLLPAEGGEASALTDLSTGVSNPLWSPDGRHIAFVSEVWPECGADDACNKRLDGMKEKNPLEAHLADELLFRHWNFWSDGKVPHILLVEVATKKVRDLTPSDREAPPFSVGGAHEFAFSPDGKELAFMQNPDPRSRLALSTNTDIFLLPLEPGPDGKPLPARNLTAANTAWDGTPFYSPDGRFLAYRFQVKPGYESDKLRLAVVDRTTGERRVLTEDFDADVDALAWLPGSQGLVFQSAREGKSVLFRLLLDKPVPEQLSDFTSVDEWVLSGDGKIAFAVRRAADAPTELWAIPLEGGAAPRRLTFHNRQLETEVDLRPMESLWIEGAAGRKIQTFLIKPHGFDPQKKYPLIVNVHGGPHMMWTDNFRGDWQVYPGAGYIVAVPNPHGSTGYGQAFSDGIVGDWGGKVIEDILKVTDHLARLPFVDPERIGAMGWSWGGYAMLWLEGTTQRYKALASMMGIYDLPGMWSGTEELWFPEWEMGGTPWESDLYEKWNPARLAGRFKTPMLLITGEKDYRIPYTQSIQAFTALRRQGVPARLVVLPNAGHWPGWYEMAFYYTLHLDWFQKYLGGGGPPWPVEDFLHGRVFDPETGKRRAQ